MTITVQWSFGLRSFTRSVVVLFSAPNRCFFFFELCKKVERNSKKTNDKNIRLRTENFPGNANARDDILEMKRTRMLLLIKKIIDTMA